MLLRLSEQKVSESCAHALLLRRPAFGTVRHRPSTQFISEGEESLRGGYPDRSAVQASHPGRAYAKSTSRSPSGCCLIGRPYIPGDLCKQLLHKCLVGEGLGEVRMYFRFRVRYPLPAGCRGRPAAPQTAGELSDSRRSPGP